MTFRFETTPLGPRPECDAEVLAASRGGRIAPDLHDAFVAHGEAAVENLTALRSGAALCVTTGQQPGLFLGPLFTLYKAVSVVGLARTLGARLDRPVVPVFWVAGDDHDLAEANHVHVINQDNEIVPVVLRERDPAAPLVPLYREPLGEEVAAAVERVRESTPETEFQKDVFTWVRDHYRPQADFATAFAGALAALLGREGLVVFRPTHPSAKRAMAALLLRALREAADLDAALHRRARDLESAGRAVPVTVGEEATTVMIEGALGRDRLMLENGVFVSRRSRETWSLEDLEAIAADEPERLSPNVLLRPVVEAALLPTLAYAAGPGELAYLPQCAPLFERLEVSPPAAVPRWSARILEARVAKVLEKYAIAPEDLAAEGQAETRLVRDEVPAAAREALTALRRSLGREYGQLQEAAVSIDPTLKKTVVSARNSALAGVADVEKRLVAHLKKQNTILVQQIAKARHNLFPLGRPQERVLNLIPYAVRYGDAFREAALEHAGEWFAALESATPGT